MKNYLALPVIEGLRKNEHILLYGKLGEITLAEEKEIMDFLEQEYRHESISYPYSPPSFDATAALWAAKTVYVVAQLLLYRDQKSEELDKILPPYMGTKDAGMVLSADLCLRFLPSLLNQAATIDSEDPLIPKIEAMLQEWHYSGIAAIKETENLDFMPVLMSPCLLQLYCDRVIKHRHLGLAKQPKLKKIIAANLGLFAKDWWSDFKIMYENG